MSCISCTGINESSNVTHTLLAGTDGVRANDKVKKLLSLFIFFTSNSNKTIHLDFLAISNLSIVNKELYRKYHYEFLGILANKSISVQPYFPSNNEVIRIITQAVPSPLENLCTMQLFNTQIISQALQLALNEAEKEDSKINLVLMLIDGLSTHLIGTKNSSICKKEKANMVINIALQKYLEYCKLSYETLSYPRNTRGKAAARCHHIIEVLIQSESRTKRWKWKFFDKGKLGKSYDKDLNPRYQSLADWK